MGLRFRQGPSSSLVMAPPELTAYGGINAPQPPSILRGSIARLVTTVSISKISRIRNLFLQYDHDIIIKKPDSY